MSITPQLDVIPVNQARTLAGLLQQRIARSAGQPAYRGHDRERQAWVDSNWLQMGQGAARWQAAMRSEGLKPGDRVALVLRNCFEWVQFDQAALGLGLVSVPLYVDDRPDNVAYILNDAAVKLLLVENVRLWKRLEAALSEVPSLKRVVLLEAEENGSRPATADVRLRLAGEWLPSTNESFYVHGGEPGDLASIVYTSGTTGKPKGVMLSHHNMLADAYASLQSVPVYPSDTFLSFLPLSHTFERTIGYYAAMMAGATVAHARSVNQLAEDLQQIRPTALIAVPRIFERVHARIRAQLAAGSPIKRALFALTAKVGWQRFQHEQGRGPGGGMLILWPLLQKLVAQKIMDRLGGRVRCAISGGAALPPAISRIFIGLGLNLLQGYGLTEYSPVASVNLAHDNDPASVGPALEGVQVRIGEDDELLLKGVGVMLGYWNNHVATREAIDSEGWLHTGDKARLVGRHIHIIGRIKEILVLSNGEKLPPADMEAAITQDPLFEQVMVLGEGQAYLTAIAVLNSELWVGLAKELGLDPFDKTAVRSAKIEQRVLARLKLLLKDFPGYAKVRDVALSLDPWTPENGLITATMKLRRKVILEHFAADVERMYREKMQRVA
ncbi:MAG: AMP-dependent synthetase/ligase [Nevskiales bacterium]